MNISDRSATEPREKPPSSAGEFPELPAEKNSRMMAGAIMFGFIGLGLMLGAVLVFFFGPLTTLPSDVHGGFSHAGAWSSADDSPYELILVAIRFGPSFVLMCLGFLTGMILVTSGKLLTQDLVRLADITPAESIKIWNAAVATVAFYSLSLFICCFYVSVKCLHGRGYRVDTLSDTSWTYSTIIGLIALVLFPFTKGCKFRGLLMVSGVLSFLSLVVSTLPRF